MVDAYVCEKYMYQYLHLVCCMLLCVLEMLSFQKMFWECFSRTSSSIMYQQNFILVSVFLFWGAKTQSTWTRKFTSVFTIRCKFRFNAKFLVTGAGRNLGWKQKIPTIKYNCISMTWIIISKFQLVYTYFVPLVHCNYM